MHAILSDSTKRKQPNQHLRKWHKRVWLSACALVLMGCTAAQAGPPPGVCIDNAGDLPEVWRAPAAARDMLDRKPWTDAERQSARQAFETGLREILAYFRNKPASVWNLWDDSIESLIQATYASQNPPALDAELKQAASQNLTHLIANVHRNDPAQIDVQCEDFETLLPLAIHAHKLFPENDARASAITGRTNLASDDCDSLEDAMGFDYQDTLENGDHQTIDIERLFDLHLWSIWLLEAQQYGDISLPPGSKTFPKRAWDYLRDFPLPDAGQFLEGSKARRFVSFADLASHIAQIPAGIYRYPLTVKDAPKLYAFHRKNFYDLMTSGERDVFASFVDTLRQYGCKPDNDVQVRDGTRFLLQAFHVNNDSWMNMQTASTKAAGRQESPSDYSAIHLAWTAALALRDRAPKDPAPQSYGAIVRSWSSQSK